MDWRIWVGFIAFVIIAVTLDIAVFHRGKKEPVFRDAVGWTLLWMTLAILFSGVIWFLYERTPLAGIDRSPPSAEVVEGDSTPPSVDDEAGHAEKHEAVGIAPKNGLDAAIQYLSCWLLEQSLSLDNIFVIALVFASFRVPKHEQHRVLFWGILGAIILRGTMIVVGAALVREFEWILYVFGVLLLVSAAKLFFTKHEEEIPVEKHILVRIAKRFLPVVNQFHGSKFFVRIDGRLFATPMFLTLLLVEASDVIFAVDSVPAAFAVTTDPFIIFTANAFAIFGLRSLYFVLLSVLDRFRYLQTGLIVILAFVGVKILLAAGHDHLPDWAWVQFLVRPEVSLAVIAGTIAVSLAASWLVDRGKPDDLATSPDDRSPLSESTETPEETSDGVER